MGRERSIQPDGTMQVTIHVKGPMPNLPPRREQPEDSCLVWDPRRQNFQAQTIRAIRGQGWTIYPDWFPGATNMTVGNYWVLWRDRKPIWRNGTFVGPGKWLPVDFYRIKIKDDDLAPAGPATPPPVTPGL
jgi:hypothetical protein